MNEQLTAFIIKELTKHHDRKAITERVCERAGLNWRDAERLIAQVEAENKRSIAARQTPLLLFFSIGTLVLGLGLLVFNMQFLLTLFHKDILGQILSLQSGYYQILGSITGLGMTVGGLVGFWKALAAILPE